MHFLCQNKELTRRGALLDFIVTNKGRLLRDVKVRGSPAPNDMVAQNLERMEQDPSSGLEERRLAYSGICLEESHGIQSFESSEVQESGLIFKVHLLQIEKQFIPSSRKSKAA